MAKNRIKFNDKGWDEIVEHVIDTEGVPRMKRVADASNRHLDREGYKVSTEGGKRLQKQDYRVTVITATEDAMYDNQKHNRLVTEFYQAGGE